MKQNLINMYQFPISCWPKGASFLSARCVDRLGSVLGVRRSHLEDPPGAPLCKVVPPGPRAHVEPRKLKENMQLFEAE